MLRAETSHLRTGFASTLNLQRPEIRNKKKCNVRFEGVHS